MTDITPTLIEAVARAVHKCPECNGYKGKQTERRFQLVWIKCAACHGTGIDLNAAIASVIAHATSAESVRRAIVAWDNKAVASDEAGMKAAITAALTERKS
jgi:ribosomal protein L37AE/L43A